MGKLLRVLGPVVTLILVLVTIQAAFLSVVEVPWNDMIRAAVSAAYRSGSGARGNLSQGLGTTLDSCAAADAASGDGSSSLQACALGLQPAGVALHPFVLFSAYRELENTVHVMGLVSRVIRDYGKPVFECSWHPAGNVHSSSLQQQQPAVITTEAILHDGRTDFSYLPYSEVVLTCEFEQDVGGDGRGGELYLNVQFAGSGETGNGRSRRHETIGKVPPILVMREKESYNFTAAVKVGGPYPYAYAFCGPPITGEIRGEVIREWLVYHLYIYQAPKAHFFFYNAGGLKEEDRALLHPFVRAGLLTIWDVNVLDEAHYPAWYDSQILFMNDCLHRARYLTDWVVFHDFDEFLYVAPPNTFSSLVQSHAQAPVLTFGSWPIDIRSCRQQGNHTEWPLERMLWRRPTPECRARSTKERLVDPFLCTGATGRRKYAVNPRKEISVGIHNTLGDSYDQAVHFNASLVRVEHYQGLLSLHKHPCVVARNRSTSTADWIEVEPFIIPVLGEAKAYVAALFKSR